MARFLRSQRVVGVRRVEELFAWQLADTFRREVVGLVRASGAVRSDLKLKGQLLGAVGAVTANISEGFARRRPLEFARFLDFAIGSLSEAESWLRHGTDLGYFDRARCEMALRYKRRAWMAAVRLKQSQVAEAERRRAAMVAARRRQ